MVLDFALVDKVVVADTFSDYLQAPGNIYYMVIFMLKNYEDTAFHKPKTMLMVSLRLAKVQRDFLYGGGAIEKKPHLVSWAKACVEKKKGGIGIKDFYILNMALLGTRNGKFFIKALYSYLDSGGAKAFPTRVIWNPWVLLRVGLFACWSTLAIGFFLIWVTMGDVFLSQDDVAKLEWGSGRKKVAESLVNCPFVSFLDHLV
ncbi:hypothetical protein CK203_077225 [Vitis vinifera]|uniref:Uncharacterized protein n=1 Tax=Vitis vinifera TaxID=29760 RepID=A0A438BUA3_VITVI|nr:hypothetical protein CK203_077225 [Vitis vinifera]